MKTKPEFPVSAPVSREQLADFLGIDRTTLYRWLKRHEIHLPSRLISPRDANMILDFFGVTNQQVKKPPENSSRNNP
ncbi:MAG TPA: helix-turn-helix domain-containing protein [Flavilitoribacter sp.]|nr:helix-turn-helix domain-containing protein [Flavilitoribacter sp.]